MKLLFFKRDGICYNLVNDFSDMLADGLRKKGCEAVFFDITPYGTGCPDRQTLEGLMNGGFDAAFAINAVGQQDYAVDGCNIYEKAGIPFINYIIDHPIEHQVALRSELKDYYVFCIDRSHVDYVKEYFPNVKDAFFFPHGGFGTLERPDEGNFLSREYDLMFSGSHYPLSDYEKEMMEFPPIIRKLVCDHIEYMTEHRDITVEEGLKNILSDMGLNDLPPEEFRKYAIATVMTYKYMKAYVREEIIRYLMASDVDFHIFGNGWEELRGEGSGHTTLHPAVPFSQTPGLFGKSKIALNIMPLFKDGSHERIPNAILNGAAILSDHSGYLDERFEGYIGFFDLNDPSGVADKAKEMLSDKTALYKMTERAFNYVKEEHTWEKRASELLNHIEEILSSAGA